jgi:hypothetical protein
MERRKIAKRREVHLFVADERRKGPFDRRGAETRFLEREREREKIERIRAFKQKDQNPSKDTPLFTKKRLVYLGLILIIVLGVLFLID